jgi:DNA-binding Lrp family transcriptional regulator
VPKATFALDHVDHELLDLLQRDSGRTLRELGELVSLSPSAVQRRIYRYRRHGVIAREVAQLDPGRLPAALLAVCLVTLERESAGCIRRSASGCSPPARCSRSTTSPASGTTS